MGASGGGRGARRVAGHLLSLELVLLHQLLDCLLGLQTLYFCVGDLRGQFPDCVLHRRVTAESNRVTSGRPRLPRLAVRQSRLTQTHGHTFFERQGYLLDVAHFEAVRRFTLLGRPHLLMLIALLSV